MIKKFIIPSFLILGSCSKKEKLTSFEWHKNSGSLAPIISNEDTFKLQTEVIAGADKIVLSRQKYGPAEIDGTFLKKVYSSDHALEFVSATSVGHLENNNVFPFTVDDVNAEFARKDLVLTLLTKKYAAIQNYKFTQPKLIISSEGRDYNLLWETSYIDKKSLCWNLRFTPDLKIKSLSKAGSQFQEVTTFVYPMGPKKSPLQEVVLKNLSSDGSLRSPRLIVTTSSSNKISSSSDFKFSPPDERFDQMQVFYFLDQALNWFELNLKVRLPQLIETEVHFGLPEKTNAAFYYQGKIRLGTGDDQVFSKIPLDPSIVTHESVHALIEAVALLPNQGEGGSLNEGFADFFTALILDNPNMGEVSYLKGPFRRTLANKSKSAEKNGGLYHDSLIVSGTLWELKEQLGTSKASSVGIKVLSLLTPQSGFTDFGQKIQIATKSSLSSKEQQIASSILKERGWL